MTSRTSAHIAVAIVLIALSGQLLSPVTAQSGASSTAMDSSTFVALVNVSSSSGGNGSSNGSDISSSTGTVNVGTTYGPCPLFPTLPIEGCDEGCTNVTFCALTDDAASALAPSPNSDWLAPSYIDGNLNDTGAPVSCLTTGQFLSGVDVVPAKVNRTGAYVWSAWVDQPWTSGQNVPVGLVVASAIGVYKTFFYPPVDTLTLLQAGNSIEAAYASASWSTRLRVEVHGGFSSVHKRFGGVGGFELNDQTPGCALVIPFYTIVISLSSGVVTGLNWQDDCSTCSTADCICSTLDCSPNDGNCGVPTSDCAFNATTFLNESSTGTVDCDIKIYLAWDGTDASGTVLTSASRTIANFRQYSLNSLYNSAVSIGNQNLPNINPGANSCFSPTTGQPCSCGTAGCAGS